MPLLMIKNGLYKHILYESFKFMFLLRKLKI